MSLNGHWQVSSIGSQHRVSQFAGHSENSAGNRRMPDLCMVRVTNKWRTASVVGTKRDALNADSGDILPAIGYAKTPWITEYLEIDVFALVVLPPVLASAASFPGQPNLSLRICFVALACGRRRTGNTASRVGTHHP
ncbi:hypothetical protein FN846DRAFT_885985 [Sphaerosporella brunnea]|uniref:Uncharacterized protein n=1 Tax=Sphaerosporella brunnea TaxID=1250544 RepID=A0A5J5FB11_9PEZI|nr:hypothetical protein FN846DRAFT_885985 [Sphaerosporella brunnea]